MIYNLWKHPMIVTHRNILIYNLWSIWLWYGNVNKNLCIWLSCRIYDRQSVKHLMIVTYRNRQSANLWSIWLSHKGIIYIDAQSVKHLIVTNSNMSIYDLFTYWLSHRIICNLRMRLSKQDALQPVLLWLSSNERERERERAVDLDPPALSLMISCCGMD